MSNFLRHPRFFLAGRRVALSADRRDVMRFMLIDGLRPAGVGLAAGAGVGALRVAARDDFPARAFRVLTKFLFVCHKPRMPTAYNRGNYPTANQVSPRLVST
jgi:hypothetical protein